MDACIELNKKRKLYTVIATNVYRWFRECEKYT